MKEEIVIFWFRRDLRLDDNIGLYHALQSQYPVLPIFIFDNDILKNLDNKRDRRVDYIYQAAKSINQELKSVNSRLEVFNGKVMNAFIKLEDNYELKAIFCNRDYEPYTIKRDTEIYNYFKKKNIPFLAYKDQVIFDKNDVLKDDEKPYTVFSPYSKKWRSSLNNEYFQEYRIKKNNFLRLSYKNILNLKDIGFERTDINFIKPELNPAIIDNYDKTRNFPAINGTTRLSVALRFGTISIRHCVNFALQHNDIWLTELIWREFFMQILYHFPQVVNNSFKPKYDNIKWINNESHFKKWCEGQTGYPIVDAGMRELNETGFMHNRVRMITASFLCKHLLTDWRWGEAYFAEKLNDYDLSANNGNWQWACGGGCDAAPYFRIFNPSTQAEKFDKDNVYIKRWVPEFEDINYPKPMIEHKAARERALKAYSEAVMGD